MDIKVIEHRQKLLTAWGKICDWVKSNTPETAVNGIVCGLPHNPYHWINFVVAPNGDAQIHYGGHGWSADDMLTKDKQYEFSPGSMSNIQSEVRGNTDKVHKTNADYAKMRADGKYTYELTADAPKGIRWSALEEVIENWQTIKEQFLNGVKQYNALDEFEP